MAELWSDEKIVEKLSYIETGSPGVPNPNRGMRITAVLVEMRNEMAACLAKLDAARARIAELEAQPPTAPPPENIDSA